ncbi:MAG TPA: hypothetical protein DCS66_13690, partial [Flavobacteriaceae bacterium]|nr:hypothetical protein [Flavobacteriaceae bacterium]
DGQEYSVAEDIIGEILLTDINRKYGERRGRPYTLEELDLQMQKTASGPRLTFKHPDGEGRQAIDPVTFDWSDVLDQLPGAYVIMGDVLGSIGGGFAGAPAGPKGIFLGATAGGAIGAMASKWMVIDTALDMGEFTYDHSKGGWVSVKSGREQVIPIDNLFDDLVNEGLWSAGGAVLGSAIFRIGKAILSKGGAEAEYFIRKEDWDDAYRRWGENKFGKQFDAEGIPSSPAYILETAARELREQADSLGLVGKERDDLINRAGRMDASASQLRQMETDYLPEAAVARQRILGLFEEGTRTLPDGTVVPPANYADVEKFGDEVVAAIRSGDGTRINNLLDSMDVANQRLLDDWNALFLGAGEGAEAAFGYNIREASNRVLGLIDGATASSAKTGI